MKDLTKMINNPDFPKYLQEKYAQLYKHPDYYSNGGIFKKKKRKQLLGFLRKTGRDRPLETLQGSKKASFWYDTRESVRNGLIDLQLFIETADDKNINRVINEESLAPIVQSIFTPFKLHYNLNDDGTKAKIALMLAENGLRYLSSLKWVAGGQRKAIDEIIGLSKLIAVSQLPENERDAFFEKGGHL
jgi:hypothetical protein